MLNTYYDWRFFGRNQMGIAVGCVIADVDVGCLHLHLHLHPC